MGWLAAYVWAELFIHSWIHGSEHLDIQIHNYQTYCHASK